MKGPGIPAPLWSVQGWVCGSDAPIGRRRVTGEIGIPHEVAELV